MSAKPDSRLERAARLPGFLRAPARVWAWRLFPYVFAGSVIALIVRRYSPQAIYAEMTKGNSLPLLPIALGTFAVSLLFVCAADSIVFRGLLEPGRVPRYRAVIRGKAATVLLHIVHYALGQGAYATWLARKTGLTVGRVTALLVYVVAAELCSVCVYASAVIAIGKPQVPVAVPALAAAIALGISGAVVLLPSLRDVLGRFVIFGPWVRMSRARGLLQLLARLPQHMTTTFGTWFAARVFGLEIPLWVMLSYVPVILIVSSLPVNVAGFGAVQGVWLLLSPWAKPEQILAFSVVWQIASCFALVARGLPFVRGALSDIREGAAPLTASDDPPDSFSEPYSAVRDTRA